MSNRVVLTRSSTRRGEHVYRWKSEIVNHGNSDTQAETAFLGN